jgi:hypothetical protein
MAKKIPCEKCKNPRDVDLHIPCDLCGAQQTLFGYMYSENARFLYWTIGIVAFIIVTLLAAYAVVMVVTELGIRNAGNGFLPSGQDLALLKLTRIAFGGLL